MEKLKRIKVIAWIAISISAIFANIWAYWGINENFHEGWYNIRFWDNVLLMFFQYLLMPIGFMVLAFVAIRWNKVGAVCHLLLAGGAFYFFGGMHAGFFLVSLPLIGLSLLYWFGRIEKRKFAYLLVIGLPLIQIFGIGTFQAIRVANRYDDHNFEARFIKGNTVELIWAPTGPGWPDNGTSWFEAKSICAHLNEDGKTLSDKELDIWRLPSINEAVCSQVYHGHNAGGSWNNASGKALYKDQPDKESPLWNMHLKTIYWWTSTELNAKTSYIIVYNGGVWPRQKKLKVGYLNFRAVKEVKQKSLIKEN
jgi:hypothetical protein